MTKGRPYETKDRLSPEQMTQLVEKPMSVFRSSGLEAAAKSFEMLLTDSVGAHGSGSEEEADLLTSFGVELFLDVDAEDDPEACSASVDYLKRAISAYRMAFGPDHPEVAVALNTYADALLQTSGETGRAEANAALEEAYSIRLAALGADNRETMATADRLGKLPENASDGEQGRSSRPDEMYVNIRNLALRTKGADIGLSKSGPKEAYGVVMDMDVGGRAATVTSFKTGDASLYLSTGGGTIGSGQESAEVAAAAEGFVAAANLFMHTMSTASTQPLPLPGEVTFYVLTSSGIYSAAAPKQALGDKMHVLSMLYYAGQAVLTEIRLLSERQDKERSRAN